jgi:helicase
MSTNAAAIAVEIIQNRRLQFELAQIRAKSALASVTGDGAGFNWSYISARLSRNATAAALGFEQLAREDTAAVKAYSEPMKQVASLWEGLANLRESTTLRSGLLQAITAYELAGYQANSICLARQLKQELAAAEGTHPLLDQFADFFLRRFLVARYPISRELPPRNGLVSGDQLVNTLASNLSSRGLAFAAEFFLSGNPERLVAAMSDLELASAAYGQIGSIELHNLTDALITLLPVMRTRSTWQVLLPVLPTAPLWSRYLKLLARGVGRDLLRTSSVSELWQSQLTALESGLLSSAQSQIVRMPTSAGKTRIAELVLIHTLITKPRSKCVYVAPYRALVGELHRHFTSLCSDLGFTVPEVLGSYDSDDLEGELVESADVLILTPEKLDLLVRLRPDIAESIQLIVLDEGQIVDDGSRGQKYELLLTRLKRRLPNVRFLFLSAVVPDQTLDDLAEWLQTRDLPATTVSTTWRPSTQRIAQFSWRGERGFLEYASTPDAPAVPGFVPGIVKQQRFEYVDPTTRRRRTVLFPEVTHKAQTAAEVAMTFANVGPVLVFCSQTNFVESVGKAISLRLDLAHRIGETLPDRYHTETTRAALVAQEWLGLDHLVTQLLRRGVALHHGSLPDSVRKAVEDDFRARRYPIIVATNTLAQGVNLPLRTVVFHSVWRTSEDGSRTRISSRDYWNIAGRAGRAGEETEGTIIHLALSATDRRDYADFVRSRLQVEPVQSFLLRVLEALVRGRVDVSQVADVLDADVMALAVEEALQDGTLSVLMEFLQASLVGVQARKRNLSVEPLARAFQGTLQRIRSRVEDRSFLPVYVTTGLASDSCEVLRQTVQDRTENFQALLTADGLAARDDLADLLLDTCSSVNEAQSDRAFAGSRSELLMDWLAGTSSEELRTKYASDAGGPEELGKFIEDLFGYRLPWVMSACMRISEKVLNLPRGEFSTLARFLPSMVRFGVPVPEAAWAMAAGVPVRASALRLARLFLAEGREGYRQFLEWLQDLPLSSVEGIGLPDGLWLELQGVLHRSVANPLIRESGGDLSVALAIELTLRRIRPDGAYILQHISPTSEARLRRDYDDFSNRNAIVLEIDTIAVASLPWRVAQLLAPELDAGLVLPVTIKQVEIDVHSGTGQLEPSFALQVAIEQPAVL